MKTAVVGGGILGLTLALRLKRLGHDVTLLESMMSLTGLINIGAGTLSVAFAQEGVFNFD